MGDAGLIPCKLCGGALLKLSRVRGTGKVPVDAHPVDRGHIIIVRNQRDEEDKALELTDEEAAVCLNLGRRLHTDHWATCPESKEIRG
jgi:hypothetical protein